MTKKIKLKKHSIKKFSRYKKNIQKRLYQKRVRGAWKLILNSPESLDADKFTITGDKALIKKFRKEIFRRFKICYKAWRELETWDAKNNIFDFRYLQTGFLHAPDIAVQILREYSSEELWNDLEYTAIHWDGSKNEIEIGEKYAYILYCSTKVLFKQKKMLGPWNRRNNVCCIISGNSEIWAYKDSSPMIHVEGETSDVSYIAKESTPCDIHVGDIRLLSVSSRFKEQVKIRSHSYGLGLIKIDCANFSFSTNKVAFLDIGKSSKGNIRFAGSHCIVVLHSNIDVTIDVRTSSYYDEKVYLCIYNIGDNIVHVNDTIEQRNKDNSNENGICNIKVDSRKHLELKVFNQHDKGFQKHWEILMVDPYEDKEEKQKMSLIYDAPYLKFNQKDYLYVISEKGIEVPGVVVYKS